MDKHRAEGDTFVIYESKEDGCWVAHSLRTDQIGTGDKIVDALADLIVALDQIARIAERDETVMYDRPAPREIQELAKNAKPLPGEIFEVAHKKARGHWPDDWKLPEPKDAHATFRAEFHETNR